MQDLAFCNTWEVSAQAEPEAWVMFFLPTCVSVSFFKTSLIMFPGTVVQRQRWKPAGDFCSKLPLNWNCPCGMAPELSKKLMGHGRPSAARPETFRKSEQLQHSLYDFPGHCWFVARVFVCKCSVCHGMASPLLRAAAFVMMNLDVTCGADCAASPV